MAVSPVEIVPDEPGIGGQDVPAWTKEAWQADGDALLAASSFDGSLHLSVGQAPFATVEADGPHESRVNVASVPHGQLSLIAHTTLEEQAGRIRIAGHICGKACALSCVHVNPHYSPAKKDSNHKAKKNDEEQSADIASRPRQRSK